MDRHYILYYLFRKDQQLHPLSRERSLQILALLKDLCRKAKETPDSSDKNYEVEKNEKF